MQDPLNGGSPGIATRAPGTQDHHADRTPYTSATRDEVPAAVRDLDQPAASLAGQARLKLIGALDGRKGATADAVEQLARTVQRSGERFEGRQDWIASAVGRGAAELDVLAGTIRDKDIGEFASEVGAFARRRPAVFMSAALVAGFAVARLGKLVAGDLSRDDLPMMGDVRNGDADPRGNPRPGHSLGELAGGLADDVRDLVRGELALARAEFDQKLHGLIGGAISLIGGALVAFAGLVVLLEGGAAALARWLPAWAALLVVGLVIVVVGGLIARAGLARLSLRNLTPDRTAANLKQDGRILKEHL